MGHHISRTRLVTYPLALMTTMAALTFAVAQSGAPALDESGSTLMYPLFQTWITAYRQVDSKLQIRAAATGSGAGIAQAIAKQVQIGTSDAYMSDNQAMANPHILNIPLAISAQTVDANLPELRGRSLKLSGPVLADIYSGKIRQWDAGAIAELNPGVRLPHNSIVPIRRADGSGDTFIFTQFLSFSTAEEEDTTGYGKWGDKIGYGTTVNWPAVPGILTVSSNQQMVETLAKTPYSVGYLGASFQAEADKAQLTTAMLENQDGKFLLPNAESITSAAAELTPRTPPDERLTLVFAAGANSYPLINYEYAMVADQQSSPQAALAISNFLLWCISPQGGSASGLLAPVHFIPLPTAIRARSEIQIAKIR
ncbi:MAG TPA: phosphate ABC transporter substrate-binding protein PstS [Terracidiphilus sp.]